MTFCLLDAGKLRRRRRGQDGDVAVPRERSRSGEHRRDASKPRPGTEDQKSVERICKPNSVLALRLRSGRVRTIHLPLALPRWSSNLPGSFRWKRAVPLLPYLVLLRRGFAMPSPLTRDAVRSYRTVSPLPPRPCDRGSAVCFLLHFPSRCRAWPLASLLPVGVRTFLRPSTSSGRRSSDPLHVRRITDGRAV